MIKSEIFASVLRDVCEVTGISEHDIMSKSKSEEIVDARHLLVVTLRGTDKAGTMSTKIYLDINVYDAARERLRTIYREFDRVCVSFSNGKDSGLMLNMAIDVARELGKLPVYAMYIDMEAQYRHAIEFTQRMFSRPEVSGWWICLPIHLRNAVSQYMPYWLCWDKDKRAAWVREYPDNPHVVTDENFFPFFFRGMKFEEFVPRFAEWFGQGKKTAICVGICSDESLNRFRTIRNERKETYKGNMWTTKLFPGTDKEIYNCYPIYDWKVRDIWIANGKCGYDYNTRVWRTG